VRVNAIVIKKRMLTYRFEDEEHGKVKPKKQLGQAWPTTRISIDLNKNFRRRFPSASASEIYAPEFARAKCKLDQGETKDALTTGKSAVLIVGATLGNTLVDLGTCWITKASWHLLLTTIIDTFNDWCRFTRLWLSTVAAVAAAATRTATRTALYALIRLWTAHNRHEIPIRSTVAGLHTALDTTLWWTLWTSKHTTKTRYTVSALRTIVVFVFTVFLPAIFNLWLKTIKRAIISILAISTGTITTTYWSRLYRISLTEPLIVIATIPIVDTDRIALT
jgi:hypothetical protein